jgi:DNA-binding FadR family transcriptional regulator
VLEYRVAIETGAAILAAERAGREELDRLADLVKKMSKASDFEEYRRADVRFHIGVAEAGHSPRLVSVMTEVQGQVGELIAQIPHPEEVLTKSNEQHAAVVKLLRIGDGPGSARLMREHIEGTEHILAGLLPRRPRPS